MVLQRNNWSINITNISGMVVVKIRRNQHPLSRLVNHVTYAYTAKWGGRGFVVPLILEGGDAHRASHAP